MDAQTFGNAGWWGVVFDKDSTRSLKKPSIMLIVLFYEIYSLYLTAAASAAVGHLE